MRKLARAFLSVSFVFMAGQINAQDFRDIIDFDTELKQLSDKDTFDKVLDEKKILLLDGTVLSMPSKNIDSARPEILVVLQEGEWVGYSEIRSYSIKLKFVGEKWLERFFGDGENIELISIGTRIIAIAVPASWDETANMAEAEVLAVRIIN